MNAIGVFGTHGLDNLLAHMARAGRRRVGQNGDILVVGPTQKNVMGARAVDAEGALQDANTDLGFRRVEPDQDQSQRGALGRTAQPRLLQFFVQLLAGFECGRRRGIASHHHLTSGRMGPGASTR